MTLSGYAGLTVGSIEGMEVNVLGAVGGIDLRHTAIKLAGWYWDARDGWVGSDAFRY